MLEFIRISVDVEEVLENLITAAARNSDSFTDFDILCLRNRLMLLKNLKSGLWCFETHVKGNQRIFSRENRSLLKVATKFGSNEVLELAYRSEMDLMSLTTPMRVIMD